METYTKSILPIIEAKYEDFTPMERVIGDYFLHNKRKEDFSAKSISQKIFVSEASLSRFAQKCGFKGYREFIYQYEDSFTEEETKVIGHTLTVFNTYQELLNKSYSLIREEQIKKVCALLANAKRIYVCGRGSSGLAAQEMKFRFMRLGLDIDAITDRDMMRMTSVFQNEECLAFGFSLSGNTEDVRYFLKETKNRGAKTVLVTGKDSQEHKELCDMQLLIPSIKYLDHGNVISPQFPIMIFMDLIYYNYLEQDKAKKEKLHQETIKALGGKSTYENN